MVKKTYRAGPEAVLFQPAPAKFSSRKLHAEGLAPFVNSLPVSFRRSRKAPGMGLPLILMARLAAGLGVSQHDRPDPSGGARRN